jgi:hypothetical protein
VASGFARRWRRKADRWAPAASEAMGVDRWALGGFKLI